MGDTGLRPTRPSGPARTRREEWERQESFYKALADDRPTLELPELPEPQEGFGSYLLRCAEEKPAEPESSRCRHGKLYIERCHECLRYPKATDDSSQ